MAFSPGAGLTYKCIAIPPTVPAISQTAATTFSYLSPVAFFYRRIALKESPFFKSTFMRLERNPKTRENLI
jgi:hypothetical protein